MARNSQATFPRYAASMALSRHMANAQVRHAQVSAGAYRRPKLTWSGKPSLPSQARTKMFSLTSVSAPDRCEFRTVVPSRPTSSPVMTALFLAKVLQISNVNLKCRKESKVCCDLVRQAEHRRPFMVLLPLQGD